MKSDVTCTKQFKQPVDDDDGVGRVANTIGVYS